MTKIRLLLQILKINGNPVRPSIAQQSMKTGKYTFCIEHLVTAIYQLLAMRQVKMGLRSMNALMSQFIYPENHLRHREAMHSKHLPSILLPGGGMVELKILVLQK